MGAVKAESKSSGTDARFRRHSLQEGGFPLPEWREAFSGLYKSLVEVDPLHERSHASPQWLDVGGSTFMETEDIIGLLKSIYTIETEEEARSWLERYPGSKQVLLLAPRVVGNYFPDADFRLEVRTDPEMSDQYLGVYVRTDLEPAEAVEKFTAFDSRWGDQIHALTDGDLVINIESKS